MGDSPWCVQPIVTHSLYQNSSSQASGLEGCWYGNTTHSREVFNELLDIGYTGLQEIRRRNEYSFGFNQRVQQSLEGKRFDFGTFPFVEELFLWMLDTAREHFDSESGLQYREENTRAAKEKFAIGYTVSDTGKIQGQTVTLPLLDTPRGTQPLVVNPTALDDIDRASYRLVTQLGMVGCPLVRAFKEAGLFQDYLPLIVRKRRVYGVR